MKRVSVTNLDRCTAQEVFDFIVHHLLTQKQRAVGISGCRYLATDGKKCAAGCLIPAKCYRPSFEGKRWRSLPFYSKHDDLIVSLQTIHDQYPAKKWRRLLAGRAETEGLKFNPP